VPVPPVAVAVERAVAGLSPDLLRSVVRVMTVHDDPDYEQPWQTRGPSSSAGSGAIVQTGRGLRVLTNGHVVQNQAFVEVKRYGQAVKYPAVVEGVGHECDLALLRVGAREFFHDVTPIAIGVLPELSEIVSVLGYPIGGTRLSITQGVISRIDMTPYAQSQRRLLAGQIDAAINPGNSGGPVVREGRLVGVAFQSLEEGQNIGYMIAAPVVQHFLIDLENGTFDGFPDLGLVAQTLESASHRRSLGLRQDHGVLITGVVYHGSCYGVLHVGDVLLAVDGVKIAADGTVPFQSEARIDLAYVVSRCHVGQGVEVEVWRNRRQRRFSIRLRQPQYLVPEDRYDERPTYFLYGGLLFAPLSRDYLKTWGSNWWNNAPRNLVAIYEQCIKTEARQEVVLLQKVLADAVNQGYHNYESLEITKVQDKPVRSLRHLISEVERRTGPFVKFETSDGARIVLARRDAERRNGVVMRRFGVPRDRSLDLVPRSEPRSRRSSR
jgi:S1-C subfamily serine protease